MSAHDTPPPDSEPAAPPSLPGTGLWSDSDAVDTVAMPLPDESPSLPPQPAAGAAPIGHIGRYALKSLIGEGGLGTVYAAQDPLLSRTIAIKTLTPQIPAAEREAFTARF